VCAGSDTSIRRVYSWLCGRGVPDRVTDPMPLAELTAAMVALYQAQPRLGTDDPLARLGDGVPDFDPARLFARPSALLAAAFASPTAAGVEGLAHHWGLDPGEPIAIRNDARSPRS